MLLPFACSIFLSFFLIFCNVSNNSPVIIGFICDALCDLVPFAQFKKCEKHSWRSDAFTKSKTSPWVSLTFFKLYKWYRMTQSISYGLAETLHLVLQFVLIFMILLRFLQYFCCQPKNCPILTEKFNLTQYTTDWSKSSACFRSLESF